MNRIFFSKCVRNSFFGLIYFRYPKSRINTRFSRSITFFMILEFSNSFFFLQFEKIYSTNDDIYIFYNKINVKKLLHTFFTYVAMSSSVIGSAETAPRLLTAEKFCGKGIGDSTSSPSALGDIGTALDPVFES